MPNRDVYHETVKTALQRDGWAITHDPFKLRYGRHNLYADLGAERLFIAEKETHKIVVEVKSFISLSEVADLQEAIGSYAMYRNILEETEPDWVIYLAVPLDAYEGVFSKSLGQLMTAKERLRLIVFDQLNEVIERWIH